MIKLTQEEKEKIKRAVNNAELNTSGEFVTVIARQSDSYFYIPLLWAALITMLVPPVMIYIIKNQSARLVYDIQVITFVVMYFFFQIQTIKMFLVPKQIKRLQASQLAFEQFYRQGVSNTVQRAGILFFVSYAEKHVEIIADAGINKLVSPDQWQNIIDEFIARVKEDRVSDGFISAIEKCAQLLMTHFPGQKHDINELSDKMIEI